VPPAVINRDAAGRATIRAVRVRTPPRIDGVLDDAAYAEAPHFSGFIQAEPLEGQPATQRTDVWLLYDDEHLYVTARCWEEHPDRIVANEMRRDSFNIFSANDAFGFALDTFYDRRNAVTFTINAIGGKIDGQATDERQFNGDFNTVWDVRTGRFDGGWTVEVAMPFRSLRYRPGRGQIWGFNARRFTPWKNETSFLVPIPASRLNFGLVSMSLAATVVDLEVPGAARNLEIKPFVTSSVSFDNVVRPAVSNDLDADVGLDLKYGVTQGLTADLTVNTDFAQVEADEQQVNLTRFSLFFPEKREFFLENRGTFDFGAAAVGAMGGGGEVPNLFYSRRIGLQQGTVVPIEVGGRLTGRVGRYSLGALNIQSADDETLGARRTNFTVARLKRDVLRRSSIGALVTYRSLRETGPGSNTVFGVDGAFAFHDNLVINTYWATTRTPGVAGDDTSYRGQFDYNADRYGLQAERLVVGDKFNPEIGFVRRDNMQRNYAQARFSPRPASIAAIRRFWFSTSLTHVQDGAGVLETREVESEFRIEMQNSDRLSVAYANTHEFLPRPFRIAANVTLPVGGYDFQEGRASYTFGTHRRVSGTVAVERGSFYGGARTSFSVGQGRMEVSPRFSLQPTFSVNWVTVPQGDFTTRLAGTRVTFTMTPLMFVSALVQYNASANVLASNVRLRWEYQPGSELFVVYNDQRDTRVRGFPELANRALIVKINRLWRV